MFANGRFAPVEVIRKLVGICTSVIVLRCRAFRWPFRVGERITHRRPALSQRLNDREPSFGERWDVATVVSSKHKLLARGYASAGASSIGAARAGWRARVPRYAAEIVELFLGKPCVLSRQARNRPDAHPLLACNGPDAVPTVNQSGYIDGAVRPGSGGRRHSRPTQRRDGRGASLFNDKCVRVAL